MKKIFNRSLFFAAVTCLTAHGMRQDPNMRWVKFVNDSKEPHVLMIQGDVLIEELGKNTRDTVKANFPPHTRIGLAKLLSVQDYNKTASQFEIEIHPSSRVYFNTRKGFCMLQALSYRVKGNPRAAIVFKLSVPGENVVNKVTQGPNDIAVVRINEDGTPSFANN